MIVLPSVVAPGDTMKFVHASDTCSSRSNGAARAKYVAIVVILGS